MGSFLTFLHKKPVLYVAGVRWKDLMYCVLRGQFEKPFLVKKLVSSQASETNKKSSKPTTDKSTMVKPEKGETEQSENRNRQLL